MTDTASTLHRLLEAGGALLHAAMHVSALPAMGGGFGVIAMNTIAPGTLLARIPRSSMITASSARQYIISCGGSSSGPSLSPSNTIIAFLLLAALRHGRFGAAHMSNGTDSNAWTRPWILSLPSHYDNLLELREPNSDVATDMFLRPSLRFARQREKVMREQQCVLREFHACQRALPSLLESVTLDQFLWAYNTLMSRGFAYDPEVWALMPWVDYFNYALDSNATMYFDAGQGAYLFESTRTIRCGEQILLHYGAYTDMELLLWYGFTLTPQLLPQLYADSASAPSRTDIFRQLLHMQTNAFHETCEKCDSDSDGDGEQWRRAVHRALGFSFSPLAEADGSYPPPSPRGSWIEKLMQKFRALRTAANDFSRSAAAAEKAASRVAAAFGRRGAVSHNASASDCRIGAMAPSAEMRRLLQRISRCAAVSETDALRAVCWAELQCNADTAEEAERGNTVMAAARQTSLDEAALLWFLSVDATDEELALYISREEDEL